MQAVFFADGNKRFILKLTQCQLQNEPFISIGEENSLHTILINACQKAGFTPNFIVQTGDLQCLRKCVEAGVGIGLAREYPRRFSSRKTRLLSVSDFDVTQTVSCYFKPETAYGNVLHFLRFLQSVVY